MARSTARSRTAQRMRVVAERDSAGIVRVLLMAGTRAFDITPWLRNMRWDAHAADGQSVTLTLVNAQLDIIPRREQP